MVQNAFDPNFNKDNEVYAVNTVAFHFMYRPVRVKQGELVRIYLVNIVERIRTVYPWVGGEAYDVQLMTATGATIGYEIEDAAPGPLPA